MRVEFGAVHGAPTEGETDRAQGFSSTSAPDGTGTTQLRLTPSLVGMDDHHTGFPSMHC